MVYRSALFAQKKNKIFQFLVINYGFQRVSLPTRLRCLYNYNESSLCVCVCSLFTLRRKYVNCTCARIIKANELYTHSVIWMWMVEIELLMMYT